MSHMDAEMSDIVVVLDGCPPQDIDKMVTKLRDAGVSVSEIDKDNGVIEGTCETAKVRSLEKIECVKYVRSVFNYIADFPSGDPRDRDDPNEDVDPSDAT